MLAMARYIGVDVGNRLLGNFGLLNISNQSFEEKEKQMAHWFNPLLTLLNLDH